MRAYSRCSCIASDIGANLFRLFFGATRRNVLKLGIKKGKYNTRYELCVLLSFDPDTLHNHSLCTSPICIRHCTYVLGRYFIFFCNPRIVDYAKTARLRHSFVVAPRHSASRDGGWWRERDSNPRCPFQDIHDFQSCSFDHSDISPIITILFASLFGAAGFGFAASALFGAGLLGAAGRLVIGRELVF